MYKTPELLLSKPSTSIKSFSPTMIKHLIKNTFLHFLKLSYLLLIFFFQCFDFFINIVKIVCYFLLLFNVWLAVAEGDGDFEIFEKGQINIILSPTSAFLCEFFSKFTQFTVVRDAAVLMRW